MKYSAMTITAYLLFSTYAHAATPSTDPVLNMANTPTDSVAAYCASRGLSNMECNRYRGDNPANTVKPAPATLPPVVVEKPITNTPIDPVAAYCASHGFSTMECNLYRGKLANTVKPVPAPVPAPIVPVVKPMPAPAPITPVVKPIPAPVPPVVATPGGTTIPAAGKPNTTTGPGVDYCASHGLNNMECELYKRNVANSVKPAPAPAPIVPVVKPIPAPVPPVVAATPGGTTIPAAGTPNTPTDPVAAYCASHGFNAMECNLYRGKLANTVKPAPAPAPIVPVVKPIPAPVPPVVAANPGGTTIPAAGKPTAPTDQVAAYCASRGLNNMECNRYRGDNAANTVKPAPTPVPTPIAPVIKPAPAALPPVVARPEVNTSKDPFVAYCVSHGLNAMECHLYLTKILKTLPPTPAAKPIATPPSATNRSGNSDSSNQSSSAVVASFCAANHLTATECANYKKRLTATH